MGNKTENKIDFVITYVDGNDPVWRQKKNEALGIITGDDRDIRYRSWDNLQYWFRCVERFAPWVNKVYLVTDNQVPDWVDQSCEKLVCVNHTDFIPKQYLPTFSSHTIEHNLFRIKGLSEQYVYFNDDLFILQPLKAEQFFKNGLPRDYALESPRSTWDPLFAHVVANNTIMLNERYNRKVVLKKYRRKIYSPVDRRRFFQNLMFRPLRRTRFFGFDNSHMPNPLLKSTCKAVWETNYNWLDSTCSRKVRSDNDVNQYIYVDYQYVNGRFIPINWDKKRRLFRLTDGRVKLVARTIKKQRYAMICINDVEELNFDTAKVIINDAFETLLPDKSMFEK